MTNKSEWHNTGGNGPATAVWVREVGRFTAYIDVMPYRCLVTMYFDGEKDLDFEGIPFKSLGQAFSWADGLMARSQKTDADRLARVIIKTSGL